MKLARVEPAATAAVPDKSAEADEGQDDHAEDHETEYSALAPLILTTTHG